MRSGLFACLKDNSRVFRLNLSFSTVIGEGGLGGALAIGVCDVLHMFQYATYSVISPEACSSILWRHPAREKDAAEALALSAHRSRKNKQRSWRKKDQPSFWAMNTKCERKGGASTLSVSVTR